MPPTVTTREVEVSGSSQIGIFPTVSESRDPTGTSQTFGSEADIPNPASGVEQSQVSFLTEDQAASAPPQRRFEKVLDGSDSTFISHLSCQMR